MPVLRSLLKSPGFTALAVIIVALGIGSATAIFSVAEAVVLRPLPFKDESALVWIWSTRTDRDKAFFSIPDFEDFRSASRTVADAAALTALAVNLTGLGEPERINGARMTANLLPLLGVEPAAGRLPRTSDDAPNAAPVAVLGHAFWRRRFGGDASLIGRVVTLNDIPHTIVGVLPPAFVIPNFDTDIVVAQSLASDPRRSERQSNFLRVIARLNPGASLAAAQAEWAALVAHNVNAYPASNAKHTAPRFVPLRDELLGNYKPAFFTLLASVGLLLAIMSANLAGLLLARGIARTREAAIRSALGASQGQIIRWLIGEGLLIATAGGIIGVLAAWWSLDAVVAIAPRDLPRAASIALDGRSVAVSLALTLLVGVIASILPALRAAQNDAADALKNGAPHTTLRSHARAALVAGQIAFSVMLLIGAGLLGRSLHRLLAIDPGFKTANVLTVQVALPFARYNTPAAANRFVEELTRRLGTLPGVEAAGVTSVVPLTGMNVRADFTLIDRPPPKPSDMPGAQNRYVGEGYFESLRVPLIRGRMFNAHDSATAPPVAIIDDTLARRYWPGENPVGRKIQIDDSGAAPRAAEIVGVVGTVKHFTLDEAALGAVYTPFRQIPRGNLAIFIGRLNFVLRASGEPLALVEPARRLIRAIDADVPVAARSLDQTFAGVVAPRAFNVHLMSFFAAMALILATVGLYATAAHAVATRRRELGIRVALGADRACIARLVFGQGARIALTGIGLGLSVSFVLARLIQGLLVETESNDPLTYTVVALLLFAVAMLACWLPARHAMRVDPTVALRTE